MFNVKNLFNKNLKTFLTLFQLKELLKLICSVTKYLDESSLILDLCSFILPKYRVLFVQHTMRHYLYTKFYEERYSFLFYSYLYTLGKRVRRFKQWSRKFISNFIFDFATLMFFFYIRYILETVFYLHQSHYRS